jgi:hypothetical protein
MTTQHEIIKATKAAMGFMDCARNCANCGHCDERKELLKPMRPNSWIYFRRCLEGSFSVKGHESCARWIPRPANPTAGTAQ